MQKSYEVVLIDLNNGTGFAQGIGEILIVVKARDAESAIKIARSIVAKSWGYKVASVVPVERSS